MATKTIGTGGDYSTVGGWITYLQTIGTLTEPEIGIVLAGSQTGGPKLFQSIVTTAVNRVTLRAQEPLHNNQQNAISNKGNARLLNLFGPNIDIRIEHMDIYDLELITNGTNRAGIVINSVTLDVNIGRNILDMNSTGSSSHGIHVTSSAAAAVVNIFRNIIFDATGVGLYLEEGSGKVYNNTVYNCDRDDLLAGLYDISHDVYDIINNLVFGCPTTDYVFTLASHTFNAGAVGADIVLSGPVTIDPDNQNFIPRNIDILFTGDGHLPSPYNICNWGGVLKEIDRAWCIGAIQLFTKPDRDKDF